VDPQTTKSNFNFQDYLKATMDQCKIDTEEKIAFGWIKAILADNFTISGMELFFNWFKLQQT